MQTREPPNTTDNSIFQLPPNSRKGILESAISGHLPAAGTPSRISRADCVSRGAVVPCCPGGSALHSPLLGLESGHAQLTTPCSSGPLAAGLLPLLCLCTSRLCYLQISLGKLEAAHHTTPHPVHVSRKGPSLAYDADALLLWPCVCARARQCVRPGLVPSSLATRAWYPRRRRSALVRRLGLTRTTRTRCPPL